MAKRLSTTNAIQVGLMLSGKLLAIIVGYLLLGLVADRLFGTAPLGLAGSVVAGSLTGSLVVYRNVRQFLN